MWTLRQIYHVHFKQSFELKTNFESIVLLENILFLRANIWNRWFTGKNQAVIYLLLIHVQNSEFEYIIVYRMKNKLITGRVNASTDDKLMRIFIDDAMFD